mmetsp:Transcript_27644/g.33559  ORF Transcript_27644/g.33559 Transcript_27644/m.33559 type:complete len:247 (+) Transcript_27644:1139-1879(+)
MRLMCRAQVENAFATLARRRRASTTLCTAVARKAFHLYVIQPSFQVLNVRTKVTFLIRLATFMIKARSLFNSLCLLIHWLRAVAFIIFVHRASPFTPTVLMPRAYWALACHACSTPLSTTTVICAAALFARCFNTFCAREYSRQVSIVLMSLRLFNFLHALRHCLILVSSVAFKSLQPLKAAVTQNRAMFLAKIFLLVGMPFTLMAHCAHIPHISAINRRFVLGTRMLVILLWFLTSLTCLNQLKK